MPFSWQDVVDIGPRVWDQPVVDHAETLRFERAPLKTRGFALRRRTAVVDGQKGLVFWCEPL
jgi:hypothetical protein